MHWKYLLFDLDGTLTPSMSGACPTGVRHFDKTQQFSSTIAHA